MPSGIYIMQNTMLRVKGEMAARGKNQESGEKGKEEENYIKKSLNGGKGLKMHLFGI